MKNKKTIVNLLIALSTFLIISFFGCSPDVTPSLYDNVGDKGTPAEITSALSVSGVTAGTPTGYAGITKISIKGKNFAAKAENNYVYFGSAKAKVLTASTTELLVQAPIIYGDTLLLKIAKPHVEEYSNSVNYKLTGAINNHYPFLANQEPHAVTCDANGAVYFSLVVSGVGEGVWKIDGDSLSLFAPKKSETFYSDLKYHSDGYILGVAPRYKYAVFQLTEGQSPKVWSTAKNRKIVFQALDFDKNKNVWAAGKGGQIACFKPDKSSKLFNYENVITALRIYNDYLYAIAGENGAQKVIRFKIYSADSLGTPENYFDFSANMGQGKVAKSLTFAADGKMFITTAPLLEGTEYSDPILFVNADGTFGTWYAGLINAAISDITWTTGTNAFVIQEKDANHQQLILKIDMERNGAPQYGR